MKKNTGFQTGHPAKNMIRNWIIYTCEENLPLIEHLCKYFTSKYSNLGITVICGEPLRGKYLRVKIAEDDSLRVKSDFIIYDTDYMLQNGLRIVGSRRECILYKDYNELNGCFLGKRLEEICLHVDNEMSEVRLDELFRHLEYLQRNRIFICHASQDSNFAQRLYGELCKAGLEVWYDKWSLRVGDSIVEKISKGIDEADFMAIILSSSSITKPWCLQEMNSALQRQLHQRRIKLLPILIEDVEVPTLFSDLLWADFRYSFEDGVKSILRAIKSTDM